jgi:hypothetical protein
MTDPKWQRIVDSLLRLIQDDAATDGERATARRKLNLILEKHSKAQEIRQYGPVQDFTFADVRRMREQGISTDGRWTGRTLEDALALMVRDYQKRLGGHRSKQRELESMVAQIEGMVASLQ